MVFQVGLGGETFAASGTRVRLLSRVRPLVYFEVEFGPVRLEANFALMEHFARVLAKAYGFFRGNRLL